jgi:hypothetical protein
MYIKSEVDHEIFRIKGHLNVTAKIFGFIFVVWMFVITVTSVWYYFESQAVFFQLGQIDVLKSEYAQSHHAMIHKINEQKEACLEIHSIFTGIVYWASILIFILEIIPVCGLIYNGFKLFKMNNILDILQKEEKAGKM